MCRPLSLVKQLFRRRPIIASSSRFERYWRKNLCLIAGLLFVWFLVTFVSAYFARDLTTFSVFGWPFPFWVAAFGAPLTYLFVIWFYAWRMDHLDEEARSPEQDE